MKHTQHGSITGGADIGGVIDLTGAGLLRDVATLALDRQDAAERPFIAMQLAGRVNKTRDTLQTVWLLSAADAGQLAAMLADAARRAGAEAAGSFERAFKDGLSQ